MIELLAIRDPLTIDTVKYLLEAGADVNSTHGNSSILQTAITYGGPHTRHSTLEVVTLLLDAGAEVHSRMGWHGTAMQTAELRLVADGYRQDLLQLEEGHEGNTLANARKLVQLMIDRGHTTYETGGIVHVSRATSALCVGG